MDDGKIMEVKPDGLRLSPVELADAIAVLRPELNKQLDVAISYLLPLSQQDCYGATCTDPCDCQICEIRKAVETLQQISNPVVRSLRPQRLNYAELVYFDAWVKINAENRGQHGLLAVLMRQLPQTELLAEYVSQRDMDVASTVVQWLGTNCCGAFVSQCEREWLSRHEERQDFEIAVQQAQPWTEYRNKSSHQKIADSIVEKQQLSDKGKSLLRSDILKAMLYAQVKAAVADLEEQFNEQAD